MNGKTTLVWLEYNIEIDDIADKDKDAQIASAVQTVGGRAMFTGVAYRQIRVEVESDKVDDLKKSLKGIDGVSAP